MNTLKKIEQRIQKLPEPSQKKVLEFIDTLLAKPSGKNTRQDDSDWYNFSLTMAMRGMGEETIIYSELDLKEKWS